MQTPQDKKEQEFLNEYLDRFEKVIYPIYSKFGFSRNTALSSYTILSEGGVFVEPDEDEEWQKP